MEKIDTDWKTTKLKSLAKLFKPLNRDWAPLNYSVYQGFFKRTNGYVAPSNSSHQAYAVGEAQHIERLWRHGSHGFQNNKRWAMLMYQTNLVGVKLSS